MGKVTGAVVVVVLREYGERITGLATDERHVVFFVVGLVLGGGCAGEAGGVDVDVSRV